jgi:hypothetical protein
VIYTNASTDPYSNTSSDINVNTSNLNSVIGSANYDIGHVFTTGSGGVAQLGCVGGANKGAGTTGLPSPTGDAFYIDYVAHEMGHQFAANHTFNTSQDPNRSGAHAYEPGSGSTIMSYAGIEGAENLQLHSDPYFHSDSIDAIRNFITNSIPGVGTATSTGNSPPTVSALTNYTIPTGTPFALTGSATDPNGDPITYEWQERDLGPATLLNTADNGLSPIMRDWVPTTSGTRLLPKLFAIQNGSTQITNSSGRPVEKLYSVARTGNWRLLVRDNKSGGGAIASNDMSLFVVNTGAPFSITSQNTAGNTYDGGTFQTLTWNVSGTTGNGINAATVKILLSTDSGNTFPYTLAASTPNDGSESVQLPYNLGSTQCRFEVVPTDNIFFDMNNANFTINLMPPPSPAPAAPVLDAASDSGASSSDGYTNFNNNAPASALTFNIGSTIAGATVNLYIDGVLRASGVASATTTTLTTDGATTISEGPHSVTARQQEPGGPGLSDASTVTQVTIDTVAPTPGSPNWLYATAPHRVTIAFSEDVQGSINDSDFAFANLTNPQTINPNASYVPNSATITFPGFTNGVLPDGNYTVSIAAGSIADLAGNPIAASSSSFFFYNADANHDRTVNVQDFNALASNYNQTGRDFTQGDFNYDTTVNVQDFNILASRYNSVLAPPSGNQPGSNPGSASGGSGSIFGGNSIGDGIFGNDEDEGGSTLIA